MELSDQTGLMFLCNCISIYVQSFKLWMRMMIILASIMNMIITKPSAANASIIIMIKKSIIL